VGLVVQPRKCFTWSPFSLHPNFFLLIDFCCPLDDIKILGVPFGFASFISSFLQDVLNEDVHHVNALSKLKDVQVIFWDHFSMFHPKTFLSILFVPSITSLSTLICIF
jgi:hypothetical protein